MDVKLVWQTKDRSFRRSAPFAVILAAGLAGAGACGEAETEEESIVTDTSAFSESSCASVVIPDSGISTPSSPIFPNSVSVTSPTTYYTCYKGYVVDINHAEEYWGLPTVGWQKTIVVKWAGPIPITKAACEAISGNAILYDHDDQFNGNPPWIYPWRVDTVGRWVRPPGLNWFCSTPTITFPLAGTLATPYSHRVAATMRTSSNATAKVKITVTRSF